MSNTKNTAALSAYSNWKKAVIATLETVIRTKVSFMIGAYNDATDDLVQDTLVSLLSGDIDPNRPQCDLSNYARIAATRITLNHMKAQGYRRHKAISGTDTMDADEGASAAVVPAGNGLASLERQIECAALANAIAAILVPEQQTFIAAMLNGESARDAGAAVGWSAPTATRRKAEIMEALREFMTEQG